MRDERDEAIERLLAALGRAEAPEGLEGRVMAGMEQRAVALREDSFRWRELGRRSAMAGAWWRGALSGLAFAMVCVGMVLLAQHVTRGSGTHRQEILMKGTLVDRSVAMPAGVEQGGLKESTDKPCASGGFRMIPASGSVQPRGDGSMRDVKHGPAKDAREDLTEEERQLIRLARHADPKDLETLNPEVQEKLEADDVAQFESFFYRPPVKVTTERDDN